MNFMPPAKLNPKHPAQPLPGIPFRVTLSVQCTARLYANSQQLERLCRFVEYFSLS